MDRQTRHDLKSDKFVQEVAQTVSFIDRNKAAFIRYGLIAVALIVVAVGFRYFNESRRSARQSELAKAMKTYNALVTESPDPRVLTFQTEEARQEAIKKEFGEFIAKNTGTKEAAIASYLLGVNAADQGELDDAVKHLLLAVEKGGAEYEGMARLALADVYAAQGKLPEAEKELRAVIAKPSALASKEQATLNLARVLARTNKDEAVKLLEPLRTESGAVSRAALSLLAEIDRP